MMAARHWWAWRMREADRFSSTIERTHDLTMVWSIELKRVTPNVGRILDSRSDRYPSRVLSLMRALAASQAAAYSSNETCPAEGSIHWPRLTFESCSVSQHSASALRSKVRLCQRRSAPSWRAR